MGILDQGILLATGLVAIYLIVRFVQHFRSADKRRPDIYYIIAFAVLLVAGLLLIIFTYAALANPLVVIVAALIPLGLSLGLVADLLPRCEKGYLAFAVLGLLAIAVTRFTGPAALATVLLAVVHSVAGLLIFVLPIWAVSQGKMPGGVAAVSVGGALIGLGGIALAALKSGGQLLFLNAEVVFIILAPLLFLMSLAFAWGFVIKVRRAP